MEQQIGIPGSGVKHRPLLNRCSMSPQRDLPLLVLIRDSVVIARDQIHSLLPRSSAPEGTRASNRRLSRLMALGQISQHPQMFPFSGRVFSITWAGLQTLEVSGLGLMSVTSESEKLLEERQMLHFLMLNKVQIELRRHLAITQWWGDRQLKSLNIAANTPTVKDYDAVAEVLLTTAKSVRLGIEYERTAKSRARYGEIRRALAKESQIRAVIYFTATEELALTVAGEVYSSNVPVLIISSVAFFLQGLDCLVRIQHGAEIVSVPFRNILEQL